MKFWKNLCVGTALCLSALSLGACGKGDVPVSVDLDGDKAISGWETLYPSMSHSDRVIAETVVDISDLAGLKAINNDNNAKVYRLVKNIDCKGETLSINLGTSILYGNNRVIRNFKLGKCNFNTEDIELDADNQIYGLFYNGTAVYDLRLFVGYQKHFDSNESKSRIIFSPFVQPNILENISVKGRLALNDHKVDACDNVDMSLLYSRIDELVVGTELAQSLSAQTTVKTASIEGLIDYNKRDSNAQIRIGSVAPYNTTDSTIYNVQADVTINSQAGAKLRLGGIVAENRGFVSTCTTTGSINNNYATLIDNASIHFDVRMGGIVGVNERLAEIKNVVNRTTINYSYDKQYMGRLDCDYRVGGIVGSNAGIVSHAQNDGNINITNLPKLIIGGIAGDNEDGIFSNIIVRGVINCSKIKEIYIAEMVGKSKYGYFETIVTKNKIEVDNSTLTSDVYLGMLTIFEDTENMDMAYNAVWSPNFKGVLMASEIKVYTQDADTDTHKYFNYNLGLRNTYEKFVENEDGNVELGPDEQPIVETVLPDVYSNLYVLFDDINGYKLLKYTGNKETATVDTLAIKYADNGGVEAIQDRSSSILSEKNFVNELGFKYGLYHNEVDLANRDLDKMAFTLGKDFHLIKFFEHKNYNGDLKYFDKTFDEECTFDMNDEMYSFLNYIIVNSKSNYIPIKVSRAFAESTFVVEDEDPEDEGIGGDSSGDNNEEPLEPIAKTLYESFADNVAALINKMLNKQLTPLYLNDSEQDIYETSSSAEPIVRYVQISFSNSAQQNASYKLLFDVREMVEAEDGENDFVVYLRYTRG